MPSVGILSAFRAARMMNVVACSSAERKGADGGCDQLRRCHHIGQKELRVSAVQPMQKLPWTERGCWQQWPVKGPPMTLQNAQESPVAFEMRAPRRRATQHQPIHRYR